MEEGFFSLQQMLEVIRLDMISIADGVVLVGQSIGILAAIVYLAKLSYEGFLGGNLMSLKSLRPFAILIVLALYPQFMTIVDGLAMAVNVGIGNAVITDHHRITDVLKTRDLNPETNTDDNLIGLEDIHAEEGEEEAGLVDYLTESVASSLNVVNWIGEKMYLAMMRFLEEILFRISHAILMIINALRVFFLVVLYICGPLVIAISLFPGMEANYMKWLGRYLSVHLWLGIGNIFEAIAMRLWRILLENGGYWTQGLGLVDHSNAVILTAWAWIFLLVIIAGYLAIPIVAGWVISANGMGQAGSLLAASFAQKAAGPIGAGISAGLGASQKAGSALFKPSPSNAPRLPPPRK